MGTKKHTVCFFHSEPWRRSGTYHVMGPNIDDETLAKLLNAFETTTAPSDFCLHNLNIHMQYNNRIHRNCSATGFSSTCALSTDFNQEMLCPCDSKLNKAAQLCKADICARNSAHGKCQDEFMRKTIGAILFPQHYASEKQK